MTDDRATETAPPADEKTPIVEYRPTQLVICPGIDFDEWQTIWTSLDQTSRSINWLVGDALVYGANAYPDKWSQALDPKYAEAQRGVLRVSLRIPPAYRREGLSWSAHREAASAQTLEERIELLDLAEKNDWGSREIAEEIRKRKERARPGWNMGPPLEEEITPNPNDAAAEEPIRDPEEIGSTRNRGPRILPANPPAAAPPPEATEAPQPPAALRQRPTLQPPPSRDAPPSPDEIRDAIVAVRQIANALVLRQSSEEDVRATESKVAAAVQIPVSLRDAEQALLAIPPQWKIRLIEGGEHVFGGRMFKVELIKGKSQMSIGVCPSLTCAVLDAAMSAKLSDMGAG